MNTSQSKDTAQQFINPSVWQFDKQSRKFLHFAGVHCAGKGSTTHCISTSHLQW